jgi:hypothetical protein
MWVVGASKSKSKRRKVINFGKALFIRQSAPKTNTSIS